MGDVRDRTLDSEMGLTHIISVIPKIGVCILKWILRTLFGRSERLKMDSNMNKRHVILMM